MASGIEMMLKASGIDVEKITSDFTALKDGVTNTLKIIDRRLANIEKQNEAILKNQGEIWQANQTALRMSSQLQLVPAQPAAQPPPLEQPNTPLMNPQPPL